MTIEQQNASLGETYQELVHRLGEGTPKIYFSSAEVALVLYRDELLQPKTLFFFPLLELFASYFCMNSFGYEY